MTRRILATALLFLLIALEAHAATLPRTHDIEPDDYFTQTWVSAAAMDPTGRWVVYTERRWDEAANARRTELWLVSTQDKKPRRLTFDGKHKSSVQWSADGSYLYFKSSREKSGASAPPYDGSQQVWRLPLQAGAWEPVTRVKDGVGAFVLARSGKAIYFTLSEEKVEDPWKSVRKTHSDVDYGHGVTSFDQLWKLDLTSWRSERILNAERVLTHVAVSPDERFVAVVSQPDETLLRGEGWSEVAIHDLKAGTRHVVTPTGWRKEHPSPHGWLGALAWSGDSKGLAFTVDFDGYPAEIMLAERQGKRFALHPLARPKGVSLMGGKLTWRGKGRELSFLGEERGRRRVYSLTTARGGRQGGSRVLTPGDVVVDHFAFDRSGKRMTATWTTPTRTAEVYLVSGAAKATPLTRVNPQNANWKWPKVSLVSWNGSGGTPVEGILELPPDYKPGKPLPMIVEIHGGPTSSSTFGRQFWIYGRTLLAARGYALFSPNYRGSTGYGDTFMTELIGRENDVEVEDILLGVDAMVKRGIADPDRLGVTGWSNGGYLVNCLITKTRRFKAAISGAGVLDQVMQWGTEDTPGHVINYMQGLPWATPKAYQDGSPLYGLHNVKTATLIHVGENDARVPADHARALYRALHVYLGVDSELLVYPGEGHGLRKFKHRKAKLAWDLAWFDKYVKGVEPPKEPEVQ